MEDNHPRVHLVPTTAWAMKNGSSGTRIQICCKFQETVVFLHVFSSYSVSP